MKSDKDEVIGYTSITNTKDIKFCASYNVFQSTAVRTYANW